MIFKTYQKLSKQQIRRGLKSLTPDGVMSQSMATLTAGAFLTAFAIQLGANNFIIGLLASIGPLSQLLQLPAIFLVERIRNRRAITVVGALISRLTFLVIAALPFIAPPKLASVFLVILLTINSSLGAMAGCSWNSWVRDLVPERVMGKYFSRRLSYAMAAGIIISLIGAAYLDIWGRHMPEHKAMGYSVLFCIGVMFGMIGITQMSRIPEQTMLKSDHGGLFKMLAKPFKEPNYRKLIFFMCSWNFAVNLAGPFFMVYMLRRIGLSMSWVIGLSILSQVVNFAFLRIWGQFTDRFSNKSVLAVSCPLMLVAIFAWPFTTMPERYVLTIPILIFIHIVLGASSAGITLATGNIALKLAPKGRATVYLATNTVMNSIAAGLSPILGGLFVDFFTVRELSWNLVYKSPNGEIAIPTLNMHGWDFFFALACVIGFYSLFRLKKVQEVGQVEEKIVISELISQVRTQVRTMTSIEGIRQMVVFPFAILMNIKDIMRSNNKPDNTNQ